MEHALERWRSEKTPAYLSGTVAAYEPDPAKAHLFREMAHAAEEQAAILAKDLEPRPRCSASKTGSAATRNPMRTTTSPKKNYPASRSLTSTGTSMRHASAWAIGV